MNKDLFIKNILWVLVPLLFYYSCARHQADSNHPNILFIAVDDMADWVSIMKGHPDVQTPNIDRIASRGILFTNAHCTSPICGPSRAAILTGLRPESTNIYHNVGTYIDYVPDAISLPRYFRDHGYHVMGAGKINHSSTKVVDSNWDEYGPGTGIVGTPFTDEELLTENMDPTIVINRDNLYITLPMNGISTIDRPDMRWSTFDWGPLDITDDDMPDGRIANWGVEQLKRNYTRPFFLAIGFYKPHQPLFVPGKYFELYDPENINLPPFIEGDPEDLSQTGKDYALLAWTAGCHKTVIEHNQWKPAVHAYLATISFVDTQIGKILEALDNSPYANNTMIVFWSDHGWHLGEKEHWGKHTPWQRSTHVPFIIIPPKNHMPENFIPGVTCDEPVNLLDLYPTLVDMCNLPEKTGLDGKSIYPLVKDPEMDWDEATVSTIGRGTNSIRTKKWRYIHYFDDTEELYDVENDPNEWINLADDVDYVTIKRQLAKYIIPDDDFKQFIRWGKWKAIIPCTGEMMLFNLYEQSGISEQHDVASENTDVVKTISQYLENEKISNRYYLIPE